MEDSVKVMEPIKKEDIIKKKKELEYFWVDPDFFII